MFTYWHPCLLTTFEIITTTWCSAKLADTFFNLTLFCLRLNALKPLQIWHILSWTISSFNIITRSLFEVRPSFQIDSRTFARLCFCFLAFFILMTFFCFIGHFYVDYLRKTNLKCVVVYNIWLKFVRNSILTIYPLICKNVPIWNTTRSILVVFIVIV